MDLHAEEQIVLFGKNVVKGSRKSEGWKARIHLAIGRPCMSGLKVGWDFRGITKVF